MTKTDEGKPVESGRPLEAPSIPATPALAPPVHDPNRGRGGSYVRDPKTGMRELVERTRS